MASLQCEGTYTALVTPMKDDAGRSLDIEALERVVEAQIAGGVDGLIPCGTTGEAATLNDAEWQTVVREVIRVARGRVPVIAGTGSNSTARTIETTRLAKALGADGALIVTPYYNKPSQAGLIAHYEAVLAAVSIPTILYNVPGRTACMMAPATVAALARHADVVAVKEASGSLDAVQEIIERTGGTFAVLSGDDGLAVPIYAVGGRGIISVVSNPAPTLTAALYRDLRAGRVDAAARGQIALRPLITALFAEPNPQPVKAAMALLGLMLPVARLPLLTASQTNQALLQAAMTTLGLLQ
jgi:4-hydroxy-tetrahydrodipicolinate synthase